jgi:exosortase
MLTATIGELRLRQRCLSASMPLLSVILTLSTLVLIWPALTHAYEVWSTTDEFSFGFLVVPTSAALLCWRFGAIRIAAARSRGDPLGVILFLATLSVYIVAWRAEIHALAGLTVPPLLWSMVLFLFGWRTARLLAFPIGFLGFGFGLFRGLLDSVGFALQGITAIGAASLAEIAGLPVVRDGFVLTSDRFAFIVAESCSGMSSLVSLLALASLWIYATRGSVVARLAVIVSTPLLVVISNTVRVAVVMFVANWLGEDAALGFFHGASSFVLFAMALFGLLVVSRSVGCKPFSFGFSY